MAFDIYGNNLRPGHCEVHPDVHEEYPCSMCTARRAATRVDAAWDREYDRHMAALEREHYAGLEQEAFADGYYPCPT